LTDLCDRLVASTLEWVRGMNQLYSSLATPLSRLEVAELGQYFSTSTLEPVRVCNVEFIGNPPAFRILEEEGIQPPLDFEQDAGGAALEYLVLFAEGRRTQDQRMTVLFHECIHVYQCHCLGIEGYLREYMRGLVDSNFEYFSNPLEQHAQTLTGSYLNSASKFSVETEVDIRLRG